MKIQLDDKLIHGVDTGAVEDENKVLLLVHGFPLDHSMWQHQIDRLSEAFRVIAPDLPGFGNSSRGGESLSMQGLADDLARLLDQLNVERVHFCGLSMGGYVGWQFWRQHADRLSSLIACDTRSQADDDVTARGRIFSADLVRKQGSAPVAEKLIPKLFADSSLTNLQAEVSTMRQVMVSTDPETIAQAQLAMSKRPDATSWLKEMKLPTLFVVGQHDGISTPAEMKSMADEVAGSCFVEVEGAGHMVPLEDPDRFNEVLTEFLGTL